MERRSFTLAAVGAVLAGLSLPAYAQGPTRPAQGLGDMLNLRPNTAGAQAPVAARYQAENVAFTFDRASSTVRFDGANEIIVLARRAGPRGDTLYVNDLGEPVLRISGLGGMTLFTPQRPQGMPVAFIAVAPAIQLETIRGQQLFSRMSQASNRVSRLMGRQVAFVAEDIDPSAATLLWDVVNLTVLAYEKNSGRERSRSRTQRIGVVEFSMGVQPDVKTEGQTLRIVVAPAKGVAGRPSSEKIARALAR